MITLITGATKGIGRAITFAFAEREYDLCITSRSAEDLKNMQKELLGKFPEIKIQFFAADLAVKKEREQLVAQINKSYSGLDIVVNNAGVYLGSESMLSEKEEIMRQSMEVNLFAPYDLTRSLIPLLKKSKQPHIINICSVASLQARSGAASYSVSKHAFLGFSRNLRAELMPHKIKVSSLLPGSTWSNSWAGADLPRERLMEPEDVAKVVLCAIDLSPSALMEEVVFGPMEGEF
ncbi:MAG: SDR family oxidoreductase [Saprospirales bacterium]|nr:MAG: SDR family oxidoreductase [Saprospirales bacterium]